MALKVYVAAAYPMRTTAVWIASYLKEKGGCEITSCWLAIQDDWTTETARRDLFDIDRADVVVLYNPVEYANMGTGGRHFEIGYGFARGKRIFILGEKSNVFHELFTTTAKIETLVEMLMSIATPVPRD